MTDEILTDETLWIPVNGLRLETGETAIQPRRHLAVITGHDGRTQHGYACELGAEKIYHLIDQIYVDPWRVQSYNCPRCQEAAEAAEATRQLLGEAEAPPF